MFAQAFRAGGMDAKSGRRPWPDRSTAGGQPPTTRGAMRFFKRFFPVVLISVLAGACSPTLDTGPVTVARTSNITLVKITDAGAGGITSETVYSEKAVAQADALDEDPAVGDPDVVGLAGGLRRSTHHGRVRGQGDRSDHAEQHGGEEQREGATHENPVSGGQTARKIPKAAPQWAATLGVSTRVGAGRGPAQNAQSSGRGGLPSSAAPKAVGSSTSSNPPATVPRSARPP